MPAPRPVVLDRRAALLLVALAAVWGGSFFFAEIALREVPPMTITLHRVVWAVPLLLLVARARGLRWPRAPRVWIGWLVMGALNNAIPFSLIFWGQTRIDSGLASILNALTAIFGAVVAALVLADEPMTRGKALGGALGVAGVAIIIGPDALGGLNPSNLGQVAVLGAAFSYALASVWGKRMLADQPPLLNALGMVMGSAVIMLPVVLAVDGVPRLDLSWPVWGALWGIAGLSTALAYGLYFAVLVRAGAANLMLVTLLIPPFAITLGAVFLGERLSGGAWAGFAVIALAFAVIDGRLIRWPRR